MGYLKCRNPLIAKVAEGFRKGRKVPIAIGMNDMVLTLRALHQLCVLCG
jgi:hypothetical protein